MTARNRKRNGADVLEMGLEALESAKAELAAKRLRRAISSAYYAARDTAIAALMAKGVQVKRHTQVLDRFKAKIVGCGAVTGRHADILQRLIEYRGVADYPHRRDLIQITQSVAAALVADAETFVKDVEAWTRAEWEKIEEEAR